MFTTPRAGGRLWDRRQSLIWTAEHDLELDSGSGAEGAGRPRQALPGLQDS